MVIGIPTLFISYYNIILLTTKTTGFDVALSPDSCFCCSFSTELRCWLKLKQQEISD